MADEARLNELLDLVEQARAEGDSETEAKAVAAYRRESAPAAPSAPELVGKPGPTSRVHMTPAKVQAMTPEARDYRGNQIMQNFAKQQMREGLDTVQGGAALASTVPASLAGGLNMSASLLGGRGVEDSLKRFEQTSDALTYRPESKGAQEVAGIAGKVLSAPDVAGQYLGDKAAEAGAPAAVSTGLRMAPDVLAAVLGGRASAEKPVARPKPKPVPTTEELRTATNAAYKRGEESGAVVKADEFGRAADEITAKAKADAVDPVLHPKSTRVIQILNERKGQDLSLQEAENIRRIALEAENDVNNIGHQSADGMRAGKIVDELDDKLDALSANDEARALNRRKMNSQLIDVMIERAQNNAGAHYTQAGMEHALRLQFKQLANNARRMKRFTPEQKAAIQKVARGGPLENTLRMFGKFDPTAGVVPFMANVASGGSLAGVGFFGRRAATKMTSRNVDAAREALVGRGLPEQRAAAPQAQANPAMEGELMARPPLALPAPTIISGPRSAPGSMFAREQMGMTPDVERAGMLHPGMARQSVPRPKALPYLPDEPGPMVVDQAGRVAPSAAQLEDYLTATGQAGLHNVRQPAARPGILEDAPKPAPKAEGLLGGSTRRTSREIRADIQHLMARARFELAQESAGSPKVRQFSAQLARLQAELEATGTTKPK